MNTRILKAAAFAAALLLGLASASAQNNTKGYYKDIFMDSGILLTSRTYLPAARTLGLSIESFVSSVNSETTKLTQVDSVRHNGGCFGDTEHEWPAGGEVQSLLGWQDFDICLSIDSEDFAFLDTAEYKNVGLGVDKAITITTPKPGKYYIAVFCATTVDAVEGKYGTSYTGRTDVLNGVPYILEVD